MAETEFTFDDGEPVDFRQEVDDMIEEVENETTEETEDVAPDDQDQTPDPEDQDDPETGDETDEEEDETPDEDVPAPKRTYPATLIKELRKLDPKGVRTCSVCAVRRPNKQIGEGKADVCDHCKD